MFILEAQRHRAFPTLAPQTPTKHAHKSNIAYKMRAPLLPGLVLLFSPVTGLFDRFFDSSPEAAVTTPINTEEDEERQLFSLCYGRDPFGMVIVASTRASFEDTYSQLIQTLNGNPAITIVNEFDHAANAQRVGLSLRPTRVVTFGNPNLGTPLMQQNMLAGLDLPQKMLVWQDEYDGTTYIGYNDPYNYLVARYGRRLRNAAAQLDTIAGALRNIAAAAAGIDASQVPPLRSRRWYRGVYVRYSAVDFETTWQQLLAAINASPANIAYTVDHQQNAAGVGLELGPSRLVVFGNPNVGTPFMAASATAGIDLPLKILVTQDDWGHVLVTTNRVGFLSYRHSFCQEDLTNAQTAVNNFLMAATAAAGP